MLRVVFATALVCGLASRSVPAQEPTAEQLRFFESKVRPVLVEHCGSCHGPEKPKGGLRLDSRSAALAGGDSGPAVVPGNLEESLLLLAISYEDDFLKMPPKGKLTREQIADLTGWVRMGAPWPGASNEQAAPVARQGPRAVTDEDRRHWAFQPIRRPGVPETTRRDWVRNPVDAFVLSRLEARGLGPNPPATRQQLIRRVAHDLTGLPPTPAEVARFVNDPAPDAYEQMIERYLASPRHGERWGRHWLDLVRFAETNSYERDNPKPSAWRYRDYVIRSFNADKPYDQFVREQLAGDELPDADTDTDTDCLIATGYYRLGIWDDEPTDREQARYDGLDDIVATTGQVFLGLTVDCARCHDHKIDPIPQTDYYSLLAFFQNINPYHNGGPTDEAPLFQSAEARIVYEARVRDLERRRNEAQAEVSALERAFVQAYQPADGPVRVRDLDDLRYRFYRDTWDRLPDFDGLKAEDSGDLPRGLFDLSPRSRDDAFGFAFEGTLIVPERGRYTFLLDADDGARLSVGGVLVVENDHNDGSGGERAAVVELAPGRVPIRLDYYQRTKGLHLNLSWSGPGFERRALSATPAETPNLTPSDLKRLIAAHGSKVLGPERFQAYRRANERLASLRRETVPVETALVVTESGPQPRDTFVLIRGNPAVPGEKVQPAFPQVLGASPPSPPAPPAGSRTTGLRTVLADWIASPDNPLTARVMANRIWQHHFGRGIVRSPNNFGLQGDVPTHPELLDWLASELIAGGWRLKPLHRLILTSNAYRMSSRSRADGLQADPANDLFWRFDPRRLSAEEIRDAILAVSGELNPKMYGPGVYPEIPAEVLAGQSMPGKGWGKSPLAEQARRSVYVHVKRSLLVPILEAFDLPETDRSSPSRFSTTQPTQALGMLNGAFLNRQAEVFSGRLAREAGDDLTAQVRLALTLATCREPSPAEVERGLALIADLQERDGLSADAARQAFALVVLNLNEFLYLD
jgi:hypothetical protein